MLVNNSNLLDYQDGKTLVIPDGTTTLDFRNLSKEQKDSISKVEYIFIPSSVVIISGITDYTFKNLKGIRVEKENSHFISDCGVLFYVRSGSAEAKSLLLYPPQKKDPFYTVQPDIISIEDYAFEYNKYLKKIIISDNVGYIGKYAFANCTSLSEINIPKGIKVLKTGVFSECDSLSSIEIPDGIRDIESYAFDCCKNLKSIIIPKSVIGISNEAMSACSNLVIECYKGSFAEIYAKTKGISYNVIDAILDEVFQEPKISEDENKGSVMSDSQISLLNKILKNLKELCIKKGLLGKVTLYEEDGLLCLHYYNVTYKAYNNRIVKEIYDEKSYNNSETRYIDDITGTKEGEIIKNYIVKTVVLIEKYIPIPVKSICFDSKKASKIGKLMRHQFEKGSVVIVLD